MILSTLQGLAFGDKTAIPFLKDFAVQTRFLVIIPLLIFAESSVDFRLKELTAQFFKSGILDEADLNQLQKIKKSILRLCESSWANLLIFLIVAINIFLRWQAAKTSFQNSWFFLPDHNTVSSSWAGIYFAFISLPVLQLLILQWIWRWVIWVVYFVKLSKLPIKLNPAHPDLAGGIGFLGFPPGPFIQVTLALAILYSATVAERIFFLHEKLSEYYFNIGGFALFSIIINVGPLLVFMKKLHVERRKGFFEYSSLVQEHHRQFDNKWLGKPVEEQIRGFADASSLTDFNTSFDTVRRMGVFPFDLKIMLSSIIIAILPLVPLFAFEYNLVDLMMKVLGMLG